jgi:hypothetical protein
VDVPGGDGGQEPLALPRGAVPHDGRPHRIDGEERHRYPGHRGLVGEDELLQHRPGAATVLGRPAQRQPTVATQLAHHCPVGRAIAVFTFARGQVGADLGRHQVGEVVAQVVAEPVVFGRKSQLHADSSFLECVPEV